MTDAFPGRCFGAIVRLRTTRPEPGGRSMRRREFIALAGGVVAVRSLLWPLAAHGQQAERSYRVGYLALLPGEDATLAKPFAQRLRELGYSEGKNLKIEYRSAESRPERLAGLASELLQANPDVLVAGFGTLTAKVAAAATRTIPIIFTSVGDPVGQAWSPASESPAPI